MRELIEVERPAARATVEPGREGAGIGSGERFAGRPVIPGRAGPDAPRGPWRAGEPG
ncbi:hypothetical protein Acy02nite_40220 [Actinoplanes cyaneus]|uniref:Uncharacterized protein n=1 Tax=Actinoplanes cyaneus TaxID=52696 RepID=A0A919MCH2_9ACTN|nr:hypothetical protein [Actinoplanes cyaneus]MCW2139609.1 hypothetical protein [Actinoplanes cyaneus]GID66141.1 hypothetical protein Acy02nite_40220 [Actinoplanes cyaneus]